ncbi:MAG: PDZ domain-containing protein [Candidatus Marinimicrobia bacterium]|nr:PDZ domain-containing protein [Candidatus Neomarinimicrobiota bacterium]
MNKMKYLTLFIVFTFCFIQGMDTTAVIVKEEDIEKNEVVENDTLQLQSRDNKAVLGVVMNNDLNFETAERKGWKEKYGALIGWVTQGSAADKAGIQSGDIITNFDNQKVLYNDHLRRLIKSKSAGDEVELFLFRDGKHFKAKVILDGEEREKNKTPIRSTYTERKPDLRLKEDHSLKIFSAHSGAGGINWEPFWYSPNWGDIDALATQYGFSPFGDDLKLGGDNYPGILLHSINFAPFDGGYGPQTIGGIYFSVGNTESKSAKDKTTNMDESMDLKVKFWGAEIGRRIPVFNSIIIQPKIKAGFWTTELTLARNNGKTYWEDISDDFNNQQINQVTLERKYYTVTPSFEMIYRFNNSLGVHFGASYIFGLQRHSGWKTDSKEFKSYDIEGSPDTKVDGYMFTIGPWLFFN